MSDLNWFVGEDKTLRFTIYDISGGLQDITDWSVQFVMHSHLKPGSNAFLTKATGSGITLTDPTNGVCEVEIEDTDTDSINGGESINMYYALRRTDAGSASVLAHGAATLQRVAKDDV